MRWPWVACRLDHVRGAGTVTLFVMLSHALTSRGASASKPLPFLLILINASVIRMERAVGTAAGWLRGTRLQQHHANVQCSK